MAEVRSVATKYSVRDGGHYTPGMIHNGTLYISGQLSIDPETGKVPKGGFKAEARQALANLKMVLDAAGVDKSAVLQCRVYIPDVAYWPQLNRRICGLFWRT